MRETAGVASKRRVRRLRRLEGDKVVREQTSPNGTQRDNYSTKGNINPIAGKPGTKEATK